MVLRETSSTGSRRSSRPLYEMEEPQTYGDPAVNEVIAYLKEARGVPKLNGSDKDNRAYAKRILNLLHKEHPTFDPIKMTKRLIAVSQCYQMYRNDPCFKTIWDNMGSLIVLSRELRGSKPKPGYTIVNGLRKWD